MELLEESGQSMSSPDLEDNYKKEDLKQETRAMHRNAHVHHVRTLFFYLYIRFMFPQSVMQVAPPADVPPEE